MKKLAITTGPSIHQENLHDMVERGLGYNFIYALNNDPDNLKELAEKADIFIGGGGRDVFPTTYGGTILKHENMDKFDLKRDVREIILISEFIKLGKPVVGVCRAMQLFCAHFLQLVLTDINFNGSTIVHSAGANGIELKDDEQQFTHFIHFGHAQESLFVNSFHHMGILKPNNGNGILNQVKENLIESFEDENCDIKIKAYAEIGGKNNPDIIEWVTGNIGESKFNLVQWHPENIWRENKASQMFLEDIKALVG